MPDGTGPLEHAAVSRDLSRDIRDWRVPFNRVVLQASEVAYVQEAIENGHVSGDGAFCRRCEAMLEEVTGAPRALMTTSGTHALELAALLIDIEPGDEVIVPTFTFSSSANAFALRGARIVFADVRPDTLNIDETLLEDLVSERTRAVVLVHYAGVGCALDPILELTGRHGIAVVEDNAHGLFGTYRGRPLGTFGTLGAQSFHETKNVTCGEGGAVLVNDPRQIERAEILREKGTDRTKFFRGQVDKYTWVDIGSSYVLSDLLAAFLAAQLEAREAIQSARRQVWETYHEALAEWSVQYDAAMPFVPPDCEQPYHMFYLLLPTAEFRNALMEHLHATRIAAVFHYLPLHLSEMGKRHGAVPGQCPVGEDVSERLLRLPFYTGLTAEDQAEVIEAVLAFDGAE